MSPILFPEPCPHIHWRMDREEFDSYTYRPGGPVKAIFGPPVYTCQICGATLDGPPEGKAMPKQPEPKPALFEEADAANLRMLADRLGEYFANGECDEALAGLRRIADAIEAELANKGKLAKAGPIKGTMTYVEYPKYEIISYEPENWRDFYPWLASE